MEALRFVLLGLATGGVYALLAQGLVLVYRGSGLLNFAQGAMAMFGAYVYYDLTVGQGWRNELAALAALVSCAVAGALVHLVVLRRMNSASALARVIATLGILLVLQSAAQLRYGSNALAVPSLLPTSTVHVFSDQLPIGVDRLCILATCVLVTAVLVAVYRWSSFGRVTAAVAENELAAASFGYSPDRIAAINWAVGSALAGLAGVLVAPILYLEPTSLVLLVVPAMAVALVGGFASFGSTLVAALALGVAQSEIQRYVAQPGWATAVPFLTIIGLLAARGRGLPLRSHVLERLPAVGSGHLRPALVASCWVAGAWLALAGGADWATALVTTAGFSIICLSVVLLTGYGGQLSLAQFVIAGVGALLAARLLAHLPLVPAVVLAVIGSAAVGALVGLPALRTRGAALAVVTLGFASALVAVVLTDPTWSGGLSGIAFPTLSLFGWVIDPFLYPERYALVALTLSVVVAVAVANLRRGVTGRRLLAVRANERAAASLGVPVAGVKLYAFALAAAVAALGGIVLAFLQPTVQTAGFDVFTCILLVAVTVTAGIGYVPGAFLGALLIPGGLVSALLQDSPEVNRFLPLVGGITLTLTLMTTPDGSFQLLRRAAAPALDVLERVRWPRRSPREVRGPAPAAGRVPASVLTVRGVSVSFGGVHALQDVSLELRPGQVHGLIGPNGAGKTTLIDALTGFVPLDAGVLTLASDDIGRWSPRRRCRAGLSRSFQSLELFDDLTIEENVAVATEHAGVLRWITDLVRPGRIRLPALARAAVADFDLKGVLQVRPAEVSFAQRKIVAIARAVAAGPAVLLLDEPAAGLDDREAAALGALIRRLADDWGMAVLLVEHRVDMILSLSDAITVLDAGRVLASGSCEDIRADPDVLAAYLGAAVLR